MLNYQSMGDPRFPNLIILHGLMGSSRNWLSLAKQLEAYYNIFLIDLRNHGASPHFDSMTYKEMADDIHHICQIESLQEIQLMGHSMGGKVAMQFSIDYPELLDRLIVLDIAPKQYKPHYYETLQFINGVDISEFNNRKSLEESLEEAIPDWAFRQFILSNVKRDNSKGFYWSVNLPVIIQELDQIASSPLQINDSFDGETVFIGGDQSDFILPEDHKKIRKHFPKSEILSIESGHNIHIDNSSALLDLLI